jgi:hypothetical protein
MRIEKMETFPSDNARGRPTKYPWKEMTVGDVLVVERGDFDSAPFTNVRLAAHSWARMNAAKMVTAIRDGRLYIRREG